MNRSSLLLLLAATFLVLSFVPVSYAQVSKKAVAGARKDDVKYIKCGVCEEIVKQLTRQVKKKKEKISPKKFTEMDMIGLSENICNLKKEEADWIMFLDIVEDGDKLKLVEQKEEGECGTECKTIERACQEVMGDYDTDVAEFMYKGDVQRAALSKYLCHDLSKACKGKPPLVPKDREPGPPFIPKPSNDAEMAKVMRSISDMPGAPGMQMFSKDDIMKGRFGAGGEDDDDDDDEFDFPDLSELASAKRVRDGPGWKEQAQAALGKISSAFREGFGGIRNQLSEWWYGSSLRGKSGAIKSTSDSKSGSNSKSEL